MENPCVKIALLQEPIVGSNRIRCKTCERRCSISEGKLGYCRTRKNIDGQLYTLVYGDISSISNNPIEKKPLFHLFPGSYALTVGTWSCNSDCPWCQNWTLSKVAPDEKKGNFLSPASFIKLMKKYKSQGTSISFNEPTLLLEYSLDVFNLAKKENYYNTYVTNGYMTDEALDLLIDNGLDAMSTNVKGDAEAVKKYCGFDVEVVWRNLKRAIERGIHVEVITLVIPGVNDSENCLRGIAKRVYGDLGDSVPWHATRYHPDYEFTAPRTPVPTLEKAYMIGKEEGLKYVYLGNVPGHKWENTYCPSCGELLIKRSIFDVRLYRITEQKNCPKCGEKIPITGKYIKRKRISPFIFF